MRMSGCVNVVVRVVPHALVYIYIYIYIVLPQKLATAVCFIQEELSDDESPDDSSWMKQTVVATF